MNLRCEVELGSRNVRLSNSIADGFLVTVGLRAVEVAIAERDGCQDGIGACRASGGPGTPAEAGLGCWGVEGTRKVDWRDSGGDIVIRMCMRGRRREFAGITYRTQLGVKSMSSSATCSGG